MDAEWNGDYNRSHPSLNGVVMFRIASILLLALVTSVQAQEKLTLQKSPSPAEVTQAEDTIRMAKKNAVNLKYGGYAVVDIKIEGELTPYIVPGSDDCIRTKTIKKGVTDEGFMVDKDSDQFKWTVIPANTANDKVHVFATETGTSTLIWMTVENGKPKVVAAFQFVVGDKPQPKPPGPDNPPIPVPVDPMMERLRQAAVKDAVSGKSDKAWLPKFALIFETASNVPSGLKNVAQLDEALFQNAQQYNLPSVDILFTNLRHAIKEETYAAIGITGKENLSAIELTDARRTAASNVFKRISVALREIAK